MKWGRNLLLVPTVLMVALPAWAQRGPGRFYDPHKVITVQGKVEKVETLSRPGRMAGDDRPGQQAQMVSLKTDQGTMQVHLGPVKFLEQQQFTPKVGDSLTVTGSKLTTGKGEVILAAEVKSGSKSLTLRDAQGMPVWRGQGLGGRQRMLVPSAPAPVQPQ